ncbi:MAG: hypothetical protein DRI44_01490 [Chlamydiae bacterium]|nr:MAG: hypothetical protein DRI44_01490 [Chlamydiota bacterium]
MKFFFILMLALIVNLPLQAASLRDAKVKEIIDANTITVRVIPRVDFNSSLRKPKTVKLYGIYTPEKMTIIVEEAQNYLNSALLGEKVTVYIEKDLDNNNVIGRVKAQGIRDVSKELISLGLARRKDDDGKYEKEELKARKKKLGLWADIYQTKSKEENLYAQDNSGVKEWTMYKLKLSGYDAFYKIGTSPNKFLVYHKNAVGKVLKQYVLLGIDPHKIDVLRNGDTDEVIVQALGKQGLRFPSGKVKYFPVLKIVGRNKVFGVGGELMYYK